MIGGARSTSIATEEKKGGGGRSHRGDTDTQQAATGTGHRKTQSRLSLLFSRMTILADAGVGGADCAAGGDGQEPTLEVLGEEEDARWPCLSVIAPDRHPDASFIDLCACLLPMDIDT